MHLADCLATTALVLDDCNVSLLLGTELLSSFYLLEGLLLASQLLLSSRQSSLGRLLSSLKLVQSGLLYLSVDSLHVSLARRDLLLGFLDSLLGLLDALLVRFVKFADFLASALFVLDDCDVGFLLGAILLGSFDLLEGLLLVLQGSFLLGQSSLGRLLSSLKLVQSSLSSDSGLLLDSSSDSSHRLFASNDLP